MKRGAKSSYVRVWFHKGRREYAFPRLPDALDLESRKALCEQWCNQELVSRGICVTWKVYDDGQVVFWTTTRKLDPLDRSGFGERVEAWGTPEFIAEFISSFVQAVNDALKTIGAPPGYAAEPEPAPALPPPGPNFYRPKKRFNITSEFTCEHGGVVFVARGSARWPDGVGRSKLVTTIPLSSMPAREAHRALEEKYIRNLEMRLKRVEQGILEGPGPDSPLFGKGPTYEIKGNLTEDH